MKRRAQLLALVAVAAALSASSTRGCSTAFAKTPDAPPSPTYPIVRSGKTIGAYRIPTDAAIAGLPNAAQILYGKRLLDETLQLAPANTGSQMNCSSCHLVGGTLPFAAPYINTPHNYPSYTSRAGRVVTIQERINGCFVRSMNGTPLDPSSPEMKAMVAYMDWLAAKVPTGAKVALKQLPPINTKLVPDPARGEQIYAAQCASCHGANGEGKRDARGNIVFPPLWGDGSFNVGAGLARTYVAAAFLKGNMPLAAHATKPLGQGGVLSDQDAVDVAEYFTHMPRPDFPPKVNDWPKGGKPADARY